MLVRVPLRARDINSTSSTNQIGVKDLMDAKMRSQHDSHGTGANWATGVEHGWARSRQFHGLMAYLRLQVYSLLGST